MRLSNLVRRHLLDHFFLTDRRVGISSDGGQNVPGIGPDQIRRRHAAPDLIIPADPGLRTGMPLQRRPQVPVKGAHVVPLYPETKRVHHADQLLGLGIARPRGGPERGARLLETAFLHHVAGFFQLGHGAARHAKTKGQRRGKQAVVLGHLLLLPLAAVAEPRAYPLPEPITEADFHSFDPDKAKLGQLLFFDKVLSGNRNISCATCHHPEHGGSDGLSLGIGEGGVGLGPGRSPGTGEDRIRKRIPRNAPAIWNLGHKSIDVMFHDGRLEASNLYGNAYNSPAQEWLPEGLTTLISAQAVFPLVAQFEMAGNPKENEIAGAIHDRIDAAWPILAKRVRILPEYGEGFVKAFDSVDSPDQVTIVEVAEAIGDYINADWRSFDSPFDAYLAGDEAALTPEARSGMDLFYGKADCARCHSGPLLTDQGFHAIGLPPFGPGRTRAFDPYARDVGRMGESDRLEDAYRFRTPSLRNVARTGPWGHNGAYPTLRGIVEHHLDPDAALARWTPETANLPDAPWLDAIDFVVWQDRTEMARQALYRDLQPIALTGSEVDALLAFLDSLTGATAGQHPLGRPETVPSGLSVD